MRVGADRAERHALDDRDHRPTRRATANTLLVPGVARLLGRDAEREVMLGRLARDDRTGVLTVARPRWRRRSRRGRVVHPAIRSSPYRPRRRGPRCSVGMPSSGPRGPHRAAALAGHTEQRPSRATPGGGDQHREVAAGSQRRERPRVPVLGRPGRVGDRGADPEPGAPRLRGHGVGRAGGTGSRPTATAASRSWTSRIGWRGRSRPSSAG